MTIQQLRYIVALDDHRHFLRAADAVHVAQPTLTLQVKKLEEEINAQIFDRSQQPIVPTTLGETFILKARQILREVESLKSFVKGEKSGIEGTYKLGIIPTLAPYLLPRFLSDFSTKNPKIRLEIHELQSDKIIDQLQKNKIDFGILVTPIREKYIREIPLFQEPFLVYADSKNKLLNQKTILPIDLDPKEVWLLEEGHCFREQVLNICQTSKTVGKKHNFSFQTGTIETLKNIVKTSGGFTLLPKLAVAAHDKKHIRALSDPRPTRQVSLVTDSTFSKENLLTRLRESIVENIPNDMVKNDNYFTVEWR